MKKPDLQTDTGVRKLLVTFLTIAMSLMAGGQSPVLDEYIRTGIENNLQVRKKDLTYQKNLAALREAKGYFLPGLSFNARYTIAKGGRTIEFPVGQMLNPVLQNISALNSSMSALNPMFPVIPPYPAIDDISFSFYRPTEHETKFSLVQPLYNPTLYYNYKIKNVETGIGMIDIEITRRNLVKQITEAYYDYLKSFENTRLAAELIVLARENLRVCNSLLSNDKVTRDIVYRAEADLAGAMMNQAEATGKLNSATALFNFHLNRDLWEPVIRDTTVFVTLPLMSVDESIEASAGKRPEVALLDSWLEANKYYISLTRSEMLPVVAGVADYGFQGETYQFDSSHDYMLASVVLRWNIFSGNTNRAKTSQALLEREMLETNKEELQKQIELQIITSFYNMQTSFEAAEAAAAGLTPAVSGYNLTKALFREGLSSYTELMEAQTTMMRARTLLLALQYQFMKDKMAFSLATGDISIK